MSVRKSALLFLKHCIMLSKTSCRHAVQEVRPPSRQILIDYLKRRVPFFILYNIPYHRLTYDVAYIGQDPPCTYNRGRQRLQAPILRLPNTAPSTRGDLPRLRHLPQAPRKPNPHGLTSSRPWFCTSPSTRRRTL